MRTREKSIELSIIDEYAYMERRYTGLQAVEIPLGAVASESGYAAKLLLNVEEPKLEPDYSWCG